MVPIQDDPANSMAASYTVDMAEEVDTLEDLVREKLEAIKRTNPSLNINQLAKETAKIIEETIKSESNSPMLRNRRDDTLDEALLALATNRSPDSLTSIAKRYINPNTKKPYTRAALSARLSELTNRTGLKLRIQRSARVREICKHRALKVHERRRRECPKWNSDAWQKGIS